MLKTFKIYTLGCKVNQWDSGELARQARNIGWREAKNGADAAIINSCAVTKSALRKGRKIIVRARKENPNAKIVLIGCWPMAYGAEGLESGVDAVVAGRSFEEIRDQLTIDACRLTNIDNNTAANLHTADNTNSPDAVCGLCSGKSRYFLKIQDGCEQYCSYCVIPYARGKYQSRPEEEIVPEFESAIKAGYGEVVLCGIHLGKWGISDQAKGNWQVGAGKGAVKNNPLARLVNKLLCLKGSFRIRLSSIEINEVDDELIGLIAGSRQLCRHLHIPLQSGCDKILGLMNRPYDTDYFAERVRKIRGAIPDITITTDIIVGFPGETDDDFFEARDFIRRMDFSRLHVFQYSEHDKAPSRFLPGKVKQTVAAERSRILRDLNEDLMRKYRLSQVGKLEEVLIERKLGKGVYAGTGEHYFEAVFSADQVEKGDLQKSRIVTVRIA